MNPLKATAKALNNGLFSRCILLFILWFAYRMGEWGWAVVGTVIAKAGPADLGPALTGIAAAIGAVGVAPIAVMTWGLNAYQQMRAAQPRVIEQGAATDRRAAT